MPSSEDKLEDELATLRATISTTLDLIAKLSSSTTAAASSSDNALNALDLAHDAASLIRAHSTKISLLTINKPFSASAITKVLRELVTGPLPALSSAVELCDATKYTKSMSAELQWHAKKVFRELAVLVKAVPLDGKALSEDAKNGTGKTEGNGSLASTGMVWQACDGVIELKTLGVAGLVTKMAEDYRELIDDALWEMQEWSEKTGDDDDEDPIVGSGDEDDAQAAVDDLFEEAQKYIPVDDTEKIRPRYESSVKRLRLVMLMYKAVIKRRFKTIPDLPLPAHPPESKGKGNRDQGMVSTVDEVMDLMKKIPEATDELASAFYSLDTKEIDERMDGCFLTGFQTVELLVNNWEGQKDEFSTWAGKFQTAMKQSW